MSELSKYESKPSLTGKIIPLEDRVRQRQIKLWDGLPRALFFN